MESTFKSRLTDFVKIYCKMGQNSFEKHCGMPNGTINAIRDGISTKTLAKIMIAYPELNLDWLILGEGEMLKNSPILTQNENDEDLPIQSDKTHQNSNLAPNQGELEFLRSLVLSQQEIIKNLSKGFNVSQTITK